MAMVRASTNAFVSAFCVEATRLCPATRNVGNPQQFCRAANAVSVETHSNAVHDKVLASHPDHVPAPSQSLDHACRCLAQPYFVQQYFVRQRLPWILQ